LEEGGKHHNFISVGCWNVLAGGKAQSGRKWLTTSLQISYSSETDGWNRCGCEAAMAREKDCGEHEDGAGANAEGVERLEEKWWQRKERSGSRSDPLLKADSARSA
jgi:hypothetical protein